jgi:acyl dehydratase
MTTERDEILALYEGQARDEVEDLLSKVGVIQQSTYTYNQYATTDSIRHYAEGIGDDNPLWIDEDYAAKTQWGSVVAPPSFIWSCNPDGGYYLDHFTGLMIGSVYKFYKPIKAGDRVNVTWTIPEVKVQHTRHAKPALREPHQYFYRDNDGDLFSELIQIEYRFLRKDINHEQYLAEEVTRPTYTDEELQAIDDAYAAEQRCGAEPRYWEDVNVGDELPTIVKGPWSIRDAVSYYMGIGSEPHGAFRNFWKYKANARPYYILVDPVSGLPEVMRMHHVGTAHARARGFPFAFEVGPSRVASQMHCLTNWMGDDGFLVDIESRLRRPVCEGDTYWLSGAVTKKLEDERGRLVKVEITAVNQRGEETAPAWATIALPSRG